MKEKDLKLIVKEKYGTIASQSTLIKQQGCCGTSGCCGELEFSMIGEEYKGVEGHQPEADLGLGCGLPTQFARIKPGDSVLDLGSGAGNDCFVVRSIVGENGKVTGLDFTAEMIVKAIRNLAKTKYANIEFIQGDIEKMPLPDNTFDVVVSNCVLNLVPDKQKAFSEIYRVLKPDAHFCISDVVIAGKLPGQLKQAAEMYAGCVAGASKKTEYLELIQDTGFSNVKIHKEKLIVIPDSVMLKYISSDELKDMKLKETGIFSITVSAQK
jgi:SAM-dependent methyltransferase